MNTGTFRLVCAACGREVARLTSEGGGRGLCDVCRLIRAQPA